MRSQAAAGQSAFEASQYQLEWVYQSIAAQTAKTWYLVTEAALQEKLAVEALELYQRTLDLVNARYAQGQVTSRETALARANVAAGRGRQDTAGLWVTTSRGRCPGSGCCLLMSVKDVFPTGPVLICNGTTFPT